MRPATAIVTGPPVPGSTLEDDLNSLGFEVRRAAGAADAAELLAGLPADQRAALVDSGFVGHRHALRLGLTDPRFDAAAVPGALAAQPAARPVLARALEATGTPPGRPAGRSGLVAVPLPDRLAAVLDDSGTPVHRPALGTLVAEVPEDGEQRAGALRAVAAVDDEEVRLRSSVKARDGFFTTFCVSPYSRHLARWCADRGLTPNQVTTASLLTALAAAACAATGSRAGFVAAGLLLLLSFVLDCTDGQLARYALKYSTLGAWLDATFDRAKEYAYYAGLALGASAASGSGRGDDVWALALGAMMLQTCRHIVDFAFSEADHDADAGTGRAVALSDRLDNVAWTVWMRRMIVLPIGERWALIAVLTAVTTPRTVFLVLLVGCAFAGLYTTAGRVLRSLARPAARTDRASTALTDLADRGPLGDAFAALTAPLAARLPAFAPPAVALAGAAAVTAVSAFTPYGSAWPVLAACAACATSGLATARPLTGALDWLVPPLFRAAEYGTVLILAARAGVHGALPAAFGLVAAVAYHHYDTVYRIRGDAGAPPPWLVRGAGGHEGRTLLVTVLAAAFAASGLPTAFTVLAVLVALLVLTESIRFWTVPAAPAVHEEGEPA